MHGILEIILSDVILNTNLDGWRSVPGSDHFSKVIETISNHLRVDFCGSGALAEVPSILSRTF
jgi:hypothetical protein